VCVCVLYETLFERRVETVILSVVLILDNSFSERATRWRDKSSDQSFSLRLYGRRVDSEVRRRVQKHAYSTKHTVQRGRTVSYHIINIFVKRHGQSYSSPTQFSRRLTWPRPPVLCRLEAIKPGRHNYLGTLLPLLPSLFLISFFPFPSILHLKQATGCGAALWAAERGKRNLAHFQVEKLSSISSRSYTKVEENTLSPRCANESAW